MTTQEVMRLRKLIRRVVRAEIEVSWAGAQDPADRRAIYDEAKIAKKELEQYLRAKTTGLP
jgi:hypothetical protein